MLIYLCARKTDYEAAVDHMDASSAERGYHGLEYTRLDVWKCLKNAFPHAVRHFESIKVALNDFCESLFGADSERQSVLGYQTSNFMVQSHGYTPDLIASRYEARVRLRKDSIVAA